MTPQQYKEIHQAAFECTMLSLLYNTDLTYTISGGFWEKYYIYSLLKQCLICACLLVFSKVSYRLMLSCRSIPLFIFLFFFLRLTECSIPLTDFLFKLLPHCKWGWAELFASKCWCGPMCSSLNHLSVIKRVIILPLLTLKAEWLKGGDRAGSRGTN